MINYDRLPAHMRDGMRLYIEQHIRPGGFLMAVLSNNLTNAIGLADETNRDRLPDYVGFLYNEVPADYWGSPAKVDAHLGASQQTPAI